MLVGLLCATLAVIALFPETPIARQLRRVLIERPAHWLAELSAAKVLLWSLAALALGAAIVIAMQVRDGVAILYILPEALAWFASVEVATYLEIITAMWLLRAGVKLGAVRQALRLTVISLRRAALHAVRACLRMSRGARRPRPPRRPNANSDEDGPAFAFA